MSETGKWFVVSTVFFLAAIMCERYGFWLGSLISYIILVIAMVIWLIVNVIITAIEEMKDKK